MTKVKLNIPVDGHALNFEYTCEYDIETFISSTKKYMRVEFLLMYIVTNQINQNYVRETIEDYIHFTIEYYFREELQTAGYDNDWSWVDFITLNEDVVEKITKDVLERLIEEGLI